MNKVVLTSISEALSEFSVDELVSFGNGVFLYGNVSKENKSYKKAKDFSLIDESGNPLDEENLNIALEMEIQERVPPIPSLSSAVYDKPSAVKVGILSEIKGYLSDETINRYIRIRR